MGLFGLGGDSDAKRLAKAQVAADRDLANLEAKRRGDIAQAIQQSKEFAGNQTAIANREARSAQTGKEGMYNVALGEYTPRAQGLYDTSRASQRDILGQARGDIESLYGRGYSNLQNLVGQESEAAIQQSLRPIEGKLARQGLLGGPSGALNEALAGASERVRNQGIGRLADYQGQQTGALSNLYNQQSGQLSGLEAAYADQSKGLLDTTLGMKTGLAAERANVLSGGAKDLRSALLGIDTAGLDMTASAANAGANAQMAQILSKLEAEKNRPRSQGLAGIGSLVGAGAGALFGGPVGAQLGGSLGGIFGGVVSPGSSGSGVTPENLSSTISGWQALQAQRKAEAERKAGRG